MNKSLKLKPNKEKLKKMELERDTEIALRVDEEIVGAKSHHKSAANLSIVPFDLSITPLLLLRKIPRYDHQ